eukprot:1507678-Prymnesium_polylepis.1
MRGSARFPPKTSSRTSARTASATTRPRCPRAHRRRRALPSMGCPSPTVTNVRARLRSRRCATRYATTTALHASPATPTVRPPPPR